MTDIKKGARGRAWLAVEEDLSVRSFDEHRDEIDDAFIVMDDERVKWHAARAIQPAEDEQALENELVARLERTGFCPICGAARRDFG